MNLQGTIRKVLMEEFPQEDYSNQIIKNVSAVDSVIRSLYPNFNKEGVDVFVEGQPYTETFYDKDNDIDIDYAKYILGNRKLELNKEIYDTLENYLGEDVATYVIDWFNNEFDTNAEYVTFSF